MRTFTLYVESRRNCSCGIKLEHLDSRWQIILSVRTRCPYICFTMMCYGLFDHCCKNEFQSCLPIATHERSFVLSLPSSRKQS
jgi:hypothetical protein